MISFSYAGLPNESPSVSERDITPTSDTAVRLKWHGRPRKADALSTIHVLRSVVRRLLVP